MTCDRAILYRDNRIRRVSVTKNKRVVCSDLTSQTFWILASRAAGEFDGTLDRTKRNPGAFARQDFCTGVQRNE